MGYRVGGWRGCEGAYYCYVIDTVIVNVIVIAIVINFFALLLRKIDRLPSHETLVSHASCHLQRKSGEAF